MHLKSGHGPVFCVKLSQGQGGFQSELPVLGAKGNTQPHVLWQPSLTASSVPEDNPDAFLLIWEAGEGLSVQAAQGIL